MTSCKFGKVEMKPRPSKEEIFVRLFEEATRRWGEEAAQELRPDIERAVEAIWQVEGYKLEPEDEPSRQPGRV
jgi:hypothetical protein